MGWTVIGHVGVGFAVAAGPDNRAFASGGPCQRSCLVRDRVRLLVYPILFKGSSHRFEFRMQYAERLPASSRRQAKINFSKKRTPSQLAQGMRAIESLEIQTPASYVAALVIFVTLNSCKKI
jgi:hypothetical protein